MTDLAPLARLRLADSSRDTMLAHLRAALPNEACGLLAVPAADDRVVGVYPIRNIAAMPRVRYEGEPLDLLDAFMDMEQRGWRLGAIFHSHPASAAWPSTEDLRQARYPSALTLIVSFARPDAPTYGLFHLQGTTVAERALHFEPAPAEGEAR